MEPFKRFSSRMTPFPQENVDTDQIMPARFLKTTDKTGLGQVLFYDWRYDASGNPKPEFVLNKPEAVGAAILLAGNNFGCGSSREHAPWGLADFGFRALISTMFADIFRNNCLKNGILPIIVEKEVHQRLFRLIKENPRAEVMVDLSAQAMIMPDGTSIAFSVDPYSKKCLLQGLDDLGYLLSFSNQIAAFEASKS